LSQIAQERGQGRRGSRLAIFGVLGIAAWAVAAPSAWAATPTILSTGASAVSTNSVTFEARIDPNGEQSFYRFEYGLSNCSTSSCTKLAEGEVGPVSCPPPPGLCPVVKTALSGLAANTVYHFRVTAHATGTVRSPDQIFATRTPSFEGLPDARAYEQASPVQKSGSDIVGQAQIVKASSSGGAITFGSTFGIPGGKGAQSLPQYLAKRGAGSWSTQGILPPPSTGERARPLGWLPDLSEVFSAPIKLGDPRIEGLIAQDTSGGQPQEIAPYVPVFATFIYNYVGASKDGSVVLFESRAALPPKEGQPPLPGAREGLPNLYAWNRESGELHLASTLNELPETEAALPGGGFAGPYDWGSGINPRSLLRGGAEREYYLQDTHAVSEDGSVFFTAEGTGQLYLRENPAETQSPLDVTGKCLNLALACTIHVSASEKTDGESTTGKDPAGPAPAAFQAASADGSVAYFTSPEKLTDDANTGPEQPEAQISSDTIDGSPANLKARLIPKHAIGIAVRGNHIYWADPTSGAIARATINAGTGEAEDLRESFIVPGETSFETHPETEPGVIHSAPSAPRYVAIDPAGEHIYWTNTGPLGENTFGASKEEPVNGAGTIGRATINPGTGEAEDIQPAFISGAFNPQGIAVDAGHIYWANASTPSEGAETSIMRAPVGGGAAELLDHPVGFSGRPYGVALDGGYVYFVANEGGNDFAYLRRIPAAGGTEESLFIGKSGLRGLAIEAGNFYWASQNEGAIGRMPVTEFKVGSCTLIAACETGFITVDGAPGGLAADASHLYWAVNGEAPLNAGNDLYRFDASKPPGARLSDLSAETADEDGGEAQGVLGASADGSHVYFAANGVLAPGATAGSCKTTVAHDSLAALNGKCNLYLWDEEQVSLVARLDAGGGEGASDKLGWAPSPSELFGSGSYRPRTAFASADGETLIFRSQEQLSAYPNEGVPELYRYRVGEPAIACLSCNPAGEAPGAGPKLSSITYPNLRPGASVPVYARTLTDEGSRVFFETTEALVPADTNGEGGCLPTGTAIQAFPACTDVYEWEAPGTGSCAKDGPGYSSFNEGCIYLISTGKSPFPSLFADASLSGKDVFFFTRQSLVGQDEDELQDVYDARVEGGLASQFPQPKTTCEGAEACHGAEQSLPAEASPATPSFHGPANPKPKHAKPKKHHKRHHKKKKRAHHKRAQRGASAKREAGR
jgi:hypothetical protein